MAGARRLLDTLLRYARSVRHARPVQVWGRLAAPLRRRLTRLGLPEPPADLGRTGSGAGPSSGFSSGGFAPHEPWNDPARMRAGEIRFLDRSLRLGWPPDWRAAAASDLPLLWRFHLHYHEYLGRLEPSDRLALCRDWARTNAPGRGVGWHPYVLSRRIASWCRWLPPDPGPEIAESLWRQAAYLARNVERHVLGNHLLDNARALVLAAAWFGDRREVIDWRARGLEILRDQTPEQLLPDGVHFERSPMYQAQVLEMYLDVVSVLPLGHSHRPRLEEATRRLGDALASLTHPDGGISLLNDAVLDGASAPEALLARLTALTGHEPAPRAALPQAGYFVWDRDPAWLVVDGGPIGPGHLTAHSHADIFSYELSLGGRRFVVDTGVSRYEAGPERDRERGTRAHNTVCVDGLDQAEVWSSFQVARRYPPEGVYFSVGGDDFRFRGEFGGYAKLIGDGIRHLRQMTDSTGGRGGEIRVEDTVAGQGEHRAESLVHLHPEVWVEREEGAEKTLRLTRDGVEARLVAESGRLRVEDSLYCPRFGERIESKAVVLSAERLPTRLAYRIIY